jgi:iron complex outermembrane recepter protein
MVTTKGMSKMPSKLKTLGRSMVCGGIAAAALASAIAAPATDQNLDEIVVTASKRPEALQDVASSVSVLSADQLSEQHLTQLTDYAAYLPGFNIINGGSPGLASIVVRGIASLGQGSLVGTYLGETAVGSSGGWNVAATTALDLPPYDVERIEVLRGPQGTLYGASTMGGLVKYVPQNPDLNTLAGKLGADTSVIDGASSMATSVHGMVNIPLIPNVLAIRTSAYDTHTPGYVDNAFTGAQNDNAAEEYGGRLAVLWRPSQALTVNFDAIWHRSKADDLGEITYDGIAAVPKPDGANIITANHSLGDLVQSHAFPQRFSKNIDLYSVDVNWDSGPFDVVSATSWSRTRFTEVSDLTPSFGAYYPLLTGGAIPAGLNEEPVQGSLDKFTQELRLVSPQHQMLEWLAGVYYTSERAQLDERSYAFDDSYTLIPAFAPNFFYAVVDTTYKEWAGFGDLTWHIIDSFDITGGLRYAKNDQRYIQDSGGAILPTAVVPASSSEGVLTYMANARYHFSDDTMVYFRVASGYRPGGPNSSLPGIPPSYASDKLVNYELGLKSEFLDRKVLIDPTVFYINWNNIQLIESNSVAQYFANGGKAVSKGLELTTAYAPVAGLSLGFNAAYTQSELTSLDPGASYLLTGYQLPNIPKWALSATAAYDWRLDNGWAAHAGAGVRRVDREWNAVVGLASSASTSPAIELPAYTAADLNASVAVGKVTLKAFVRNLTNVRALQGATVNSGLSGPTSVDFAIMQPRTIGVGFDLDL